MCALKHAYDFSALARFPAVTKKRPHAHLHLLLIITSSPHVQAYGMTKHDLQLPMRVLIDQQRGATQDRMTRLVQGKL